MIPLLEPYFNAAGHLFANLGTVALVVGVAYAVAYVLFWRTRNQFKRRRWWLEGPWSL